MVLDYHARNKYDYRNGKFVDDTSTQYAYYKELEFCEYVKLVMFVMNNLNSFNLEHELTYDIVSNKFIQLSNKGSCMRVVDMFNWGDSLVQDSKGEIVLNHTTLLRVSDFLCKYVFHLQAIRENVKTMCQKHAMRGTGALLLHVVNDYLMKELPTVRDMMCQDEEDPDAVPHFLWDTDPQFRNYANAKILEYEDDNEYFNIDVHT